MFKIVTKNGINVGVLIGTILAMIISWDRNKSVLFALIHGGVGWLYIIYYYFFLKKIKIQ
ncbi:hypothetical protein BTO06_17895 [Tenacibaculum sp. SZ-18]|nr:hypothetical protein BTO06_17895 [Tenacibaculum sp. SZ-18]